MTKTGAWLVLLLCAALAACGGDDGANEAGDHEVAGGSGETQEVEQPVEKNDPVKVVYYTISEG